MIRLAVRVRREHAELVLAELLELAPAGVEEVDVGQGVVEYAVYGSPGELPSLPDLNAVAGDALVEISTSHTPDDWHERWKRFHKPVLINTPDTPDTHAGARVPSLRLRPPWEAAGGPAGGEVEELVIDPGQAFGTGGHATTRLCLELLLALCASTAQRGPLLDIGTGSGVLAIAAARLGFQPVTGLDHERESVAAARENALVNRVRIDVRHFDLRHDQLPAANAAAEPVILANLLRPLLLELAQTLSLRPSHLIASGLLLDEVDQISAAFQRHVGLHERQRRQSGEWAAIWLTAAR